MPARELTRTNTLLQTIRQDGIALLLLRIGGLPKPRQQRWNDVPAVAARGNIPTEIHGVGNVLRVQGILLSDEHPYTILEILFLVVGIGNARHYPEREPDI